LIKHSIKFSVCVFLNRLLRFHAWSIYSCILFGFLEYFINLVSLTHFFVFAWFFEFFILGMKWLISDFFDYLHLVWLFICHQFFLSAMLRKLRQLFLELVIRLYLHIAALIHNMCHIKFFWLESLRDDHCGAAFKKCSIIIEWVLFWTLWN
jgi:hypothetical protein